MIFHSNTMQNMSNVRTAHLQSLYRHHIKISYRLTTYLKYFDFNLDKSIKLSKRFYINENGLF